MSKKLLPARERDPSLSENDYYRMDAEKGDRIKEQLGLEYVVLSFGPIPDPEERLLEGTFRIQEEYDSFWGRGKPYFKELVNPTWGDVYVAADECIKTTGDRHHVFLESVELEGDRLALWFGS